MPGKKAFNVVKPYPFIKTLTIEGGGTKGDLAAGAIIPLRRIGIIRQLDEVRGTSIGAFLGGLIATGFSDAEISSIIRRADLNELKGEKAKSLPGAVSLALKILHDPREGLWTGIPFENMIIEAFQEHFKSELPALRAKFGNDFDPKNLTFMQLHELVTSPENKDKKYKDFEATGTNLNKRMLTIFSWKTHPNMKIIDAIRISTSFPGAFAAVPIERKTSKRLTPEEAHTHHGDIDWYVDGGLMKNDPRFGPNLYDEFTLGIRMDSEQDWLQANGVSIEQDGFVKGLQSFIAAATSDLDEIRNNPLSTIQLITSGGTFDQTTPQERSQHVRDGRRQTEQWLEDYYIDAIYDKRSYDSISELFENEKDDLFRYIALRNRFLELAEINDLTEDEANEKKHIRETIKNLVALYQNGTENSLTKRYKDFATLQKNKITRHQAEALEEFQALPEAAGEPLATNIPDAIKKIQSAMKQMDGIVKYEGVNSADTLSLLSLQARRLVTLDKFMNRVILFKREQVEYAHITGEHKQVGALKKELNLYRDVRKNIHASLSEIANNKDYAAKDFLLDLESYIRVKTPEPGFFQLIPNYVKNNAGEQVNTTRDVYDILATVKLAKAGEISWTKAEEKVISIGKNAETYTHGLSGWLQSKSNNTFFSKFTPETHCREEVKKYEIQHEVADFRPPPILTF